MARPKVDTAIRPVTRRPEQAHTRLTVARRALNESAYSRIKRILQTDMALDKSVGQMIGNLQGVRRDAELGNLDSMRQWVVDAVSEGMAILACYDNPPEKTAHERAP